MFFLRSFAFVFLLCSSFLANAAAVFPDPVETLSIGIDEIQPITSIGNEPDVWTFTIPNEVLGGSIFFTPNDSIQDFKVTGLTGLIDLQPGVYTFTVDGKDGGYTVETTSSVPVPAAAWLMGSGLVGLISFGRRKVAIA